MRKRRVLLVGTLAVLSSLAIVALAAGEAPVQSSFTDVTIPASRVTTTFVDANGDTVTKTTIDGHFTSVVNGVTGPFHTTIFRIAHAATGISDTTGVDFCTACVDTAGNAGSIGNHLIGATGSPTHTDLGNATGTLVNDRGTYTLSVAGGVVTDSGVLAKSPCISDVHAGPLVVASGDSQCLAPGAVQAGPVTVQSGGHFYSNGATIVGPVRAESPGAISICGTSVSGPFRVSGATAPVLVGEPATGDCAGNQFGGPVSITGDTAGTDFSGNTVVGPATLTNNVGGFIFGDIAANTIAGPVTTSGNV
jgi:hypothetical protein